MDSFFPNENISRLKERIVTAFYILMPAVLFLPVRAYNVIIITFFFLLAIFFLRKRPWQIQVYKLICLAIPLLIVVYGLLFDLAQGYFAKGLGVFETFLPLIFFPLLVFFLGINDRHVYLSKVSFFVSSVIASIICVAVAIYKNIIDPDRIVYNWNYLETQKFYTENPIDPINWGFFIYMEFSNSIDFHPIYLGVYYLLAIVIGFNLLGERVAKWKKILVVSGLFTLTIQLFLLNGKMPIVIFAIVIVMISIRGIFTGLSRKRIVLIPALIIGLIAIVVFLPTVTYRLRSTFTRVIQQAQNEEEVANTANRMYLWRASWRLAKEQLLTGYGLYGSRKGLEKVHTSRNLQYYNSHNQYLMLLLVSGIGGLLLFMIGYGAMFRYAIESKDYVYLAFLIIIALAMLTENFLSRQKGIILYAFFNCLFLMKPESRLQPKSRIDTSSGL